MRTLLETIGLVSFVKTTGGKGLHVVVPIEPTVLWDNVKGFTKALADMFSKTFPNRYLSHMSKEARQGKIFIDYLRNDSAATAIAAYALRARKNAPVAMPISWDDLSKRDLRFDYFNARNAMHRLKRQKRDPWAELTTLSQSLTDDMMKRVGYQPVAHPSVKKKSRWKR